MAIEPIVASSPRMSAAAVPSPGFMVSALPRRHRKPKSWGAPAKPIFELRFSGSWPTTTRARGRSRCRPTRRGREILAFVAEMHGFATYEADVRARELLWELDLADAAEEYAINYSMGMKKKLGLACALIHDPPVLILDEPTNGLDPRAAREVQDRLRRSAIEGKTIFLSTHLLDMAERLCSRLGIIHKGEVVAVGGLESLREK